MSENRAVRIGVIGAGMIGQIHLKNYIEKLPRQTQIVALADLNEQTARSAADRYGVPHVYTDFRQLLARDDLDAVDVCLHNNLHRPVTEAALRAAKHVYCEKPMAGSYRDAAAMLQAASQSGRRLAIQLATLFSNETRAARELIQAGQLGEPYHARSVGHRRRGRPFVDGYATPAFVQKVHAAGGAMFDMGVYHIAQLLYLLGNPKVARVTGKTYQKLGMDAARRAHSGYDVEEMGLGFVRFEGDLTMDILEAWAMHLDRMEGSCILGTNGGVRLDPFGFFHSIGDLDINSAVELKAAQYRWENVVGDHAYYASPQHHWVAALQGRVELLPTAELALNTMLISEAIYLSDQRGCEVTAEEVISASRSTAATA